MQILSVNTGRKLPFDNYTGATAIDKRPRAGAVHVGELGLEGDEIADLKHHGGTDQAVYLYGQPDYDWFALEEGRDMPPGMFGENLTVSEMQSQSINIGDRFQIGDVVLEASATRIPCNTFARRMGDKLWVKKFFAANRPGVYCRVIQTGAVCAGDEITLIPFEGEKIPTTELMQDYKSPDAERMRWLLKTPLHKDLRTQYEKALARATS